MKKRLAIAYVGAAIAILSLVWNLALYVGDANAATQSSGFKEEVDRGGQVITTTTDAQFLTVPANARHAWIYVKGPNPVCWGFNPTTAPTSTSGGEWPAGFIDKMDNDSLALKNVRLVSCTEGATVVKVLYTGDRRIGD